MPQNRQPPARETHRRNSLRRGRCPHRPACRHAQNRWAFATIGNAIPVTARRDPTDVCIFIIIPKNETVYKNGTVICGRAMPAPTRKSYIFCRNCRGDDCANAGRCGHRPLRRFCTFSDRNRCTRRATACRGRAQEPSKFGNAPTRNPREIEPFATGRCGHRPLRV